MSVQYTLDDVDQVAAVGQGDMTVAYAAGNDNFSVEIGENVWGDGTNNNRFQINDVLNKMLDALREAQFPEGPLATTFCTVAGINTPKGQYVVGNAATAPAITEDGFRIAYNLPIVGAGPGSGGTSSTGMGGSGSTGMRVNRLMRKFIDRIREDLVVPSVAPGG